MKRILLIMVITLPFIQSCRNYEIYFDIKEQVVCSCDKKPLKKIWVYNDSNDSLLSYRFMKKDNRRGVNRFSFDKISTDYSFTDCNDSDGTGVFKLEPNTKYSIHHLPNYIEQPGYINIETDSTGRVVYADKTTCGK